MAGFARKAMIAAFAIVIAGPAHAQARSSAQDPSYCAGAVAAYGGLDVLTYPQGATGEWAPVLGRILEALNREEGVEGMTGRYAASAAKGYWLEQPVRARATAANQCRARFGS